MKQLLLEKIKEHPMLAMVVCCAVPLIAIWIFSSFNALGSWGYYGLILLCPLMHVMMCRMGHSHSSHDGSRIEYSESVSIDENDIHQQSQLTNRLEP